MLAQLFTEKCFEHSRVDIIKSCDTDIEFLCLTCSAILNMKVVTNSLELLGDNLQSLDNQSELLHPNHVFVTIYV